MLRVKASRNPIPTEKYLLLAKIRWNPRLRLFKLYGSITVKTK